MGRGWAAAALLLALAPCRTAVGDAQATLFCGDFLTNYLIDGFGVFTALFAYTSSSYDALATCILNHTDADTGEYGGECDTIMPSFFDPTPDSNWRHTCSEGQGELTKTTITISFFPTGGTPTAGHEQLPRTTWTGSFHMCIPTACKTFTDNYGKSPWGADDDGRGDAYLVHGLPADTTLYLPLLGWDVPCWELEALGLSVDCTNSAATSYGAGGTELVARRTAYATETMVTVEAFEPMYDSFMYYGGAYLCIFFGGGAVFLLFVVVYLRRAPAGIFENAAENFDASLLEHGGGVGDGAGSVNPAEYQPMNDQGGADDKGQEDSLAKPPLDAQGLASHATTARDGGSVLETVHSWVLLAFNPVANWRGLAQRPGAAYACLDGLRAWALLWVVFFHDSDYWTFYNSWEDDFENYGTDKYTWSSKANDNMLLQWWFQWGGRGDMGVDVFFVLSGFLIGNILIKQFQTYEHGKLTTVGVFFVKRVMRLGPAYIACVLLDVWFAPTMADEHDCRVNWWKHAFFINSYYDLGGCVGQSWSISTEFQFYLASPWIILLALASPKDRRLMNGHPLRGILVFAMLFVLSLAFRTLWAVMDFGESGYGTGNANSVYQVVWMRMGPYLAGMSVALANRVWSSKQAPRPVLFSDDQTRLRWLCHGFFGAVWLTTSYFGSFPETSLNAAGLSLDPTADDFDTMYKDIPSQAGMYFCYIFNRSLFGVAVAYFMLMMLNGRAWAFNQLLSLQVWVPVARLSYSIYLLQFSMGYWTSFFVIGKHSTIFMTFIALVLFVVVQLTFSFLVAFAVWMVAEKPGMNVSGKVAKLMGRH